jgi:putative peptidoglycan lipid II flippase
MQGIADRILRHLADPRSHHRGIAKGFLQVSFFVLIAKMAGAAKEMAIAWRYGVSPTSDAYIFVLNLVSWPVAVWFSVLMVVLVPLVAQIRQDSPAELTRFRSELFGFTCIIGVGLCLIYVLGLPSLLQADWVGLSQNALAVALDMSLPLSLLLPLGAATSLCSAWMMSCGRHRNTLLEAVPAIVILVALILPPNWLPEPLIWGTVAGFALHLFSLAVPLKRMGELQSPRFVFVSPAWTGFWGSIGIVSVSQLLMSLTSIIDQFFATGLSSGALSTLSYSNRILSLVLGMGAMAISRAVLPILSAVNAEQGANVNQLAMQWAKWTFAGGLIAVFAGWLGAHWFVKLLFERGEFSPQDTVQVAEVLRYSLFQIPFYAFSVTLANLMASQKRYWVLCASSLNAVLVKFIAATILLPRFGLEGLVISTAIVYMANSLLFIGATKFWPR